jgi:hypothetical protein
MVLAPSYPEMAGLPDTCVALLAEIKALLMFEQII